MTVIGRFIINISVYHFGFVPTQGGIASILDIDNQSCTGFLARGASFTGVIPGVLARKTCILSSNIADKTLHILNSVNATSFVIGIKFLVNIGSIGHIIKKFVPTVK